MSPLRSVEVQGEEEGWSFRERSPEGAFAAEVDRALQAHRMALEHLMERHPRMDPLLSAFLEDVGNRYLDLSETLAERGRRPVQRLKSIL